MSELIYKLQKAIDNSKKSSFYKEYFANENIINSIEDFQKYPLTNSKNLINNDFKFLTSSQSDIEKIITIYSSASSGDLKRIFLSSDDIKSTIIFFAYGLSSIVKAEEKTLLMMPYELENGVGDLIIKACKSLRNEVIPINKLESFEDTFKILESVESIIGSPIEVLALARYCKGVKKTKLKLRGVLLSADYASKAVYKEIEQTFSCPVINHYGSTEMGYAGAVECLFRQGMHIREEDLYFEVLDLESKKPVKDGEFGEIVISTIKRSLMPLIRYQTGDYGRFLDYPCKCKNKSKRLDFIKGRLDLIFNEKSEISPYILDEIIFSYPEIIDYKLIDKKMIIAYFPTTCNFEKNISQKLEKYKLDFEYKFIETCEWPSFYSKKRISFF